MSNFLDWLIDQLSTLATQVGVHVEEGRLTLYAEMLADIPQTKLKSAFHRLRLEARSFPAVAAIREAALGSEQTETYVAWDLALEFTNRYVDCDPLGNFGPEHGWYKTWPKLSDRILQTVRMIGGWRTLKLMDDDDEPFVQKRFFEAYEYAPDVIDFLPAELIGPAPPIKQLKAAPAQPPAKPPQSVPSVPRIEQIAKAMPKPQHQPQTDAQFHDRKEMLRQQCEKIRGDKEKKP